MLQALLPRPRQGFLPSLLVVLLLAACSAQTPVRAPRLVEEPLPGIERPVYRLRPNDLIAVKFWGNPELDEEVRIRPDGRISLPFVDEVNAMGLSPQELDAELTRLYASELARPEITVIVREVTGQLVFVGGEVGRQGSVPILGSMTLLQAVQSAGGFLTTARRRQVLLIRTSAEGERVARSINVRPALSGRDLSADVFLQAADIIFVPRTKVTNINLFIEQYVNRLLPVQPLFTVPIFSDPILGEEEDG